MKFRADFVTNSSSSSYVTIIAVDQNGMMKKAWLEYENAVPVSELDPSAIISGEDLLHALDTQIGFVPVRTAEEIGFGASGIAVIENIRELSHLMLKDRLEFDEGSASSKKILIGQPGWKEPTKGEWEKTWRYTKSKAAEKYPDSDFDWFKDQLKKITQYLGTDAVVYVPSFILDGKVAEIGRNAFAGLEHITEVVVPEGVVVIGPGAFANCKNLKIVRLPSTLREIGAKAFAGCPELETPESPTGTAIAGNAFA